MNALKLLWLKAKLRHHERTIDGIAKQLVDVEINAAAFAIAAAKEITDTAQRASSLRAQIVELGGKP